MYAILPRLVFLESHWDVRAPDPTSRRTGCPSLVLAGPSDLNPTLIDGQRAQIGLLLTGARARKMRPECRGRYL